MKLFNQLFPKRERNTVRFVERKPERAEPESVSYIMCNDGTLKPIEDPALIEYLDKSNRD